MVMNNGSFVGREDEDDERKIECRRKERGMQIEGKENGMRGNMEEGRRSCCNTSGEGGGNKWSLYA